MIYRPLCSKAVNGYPNARDLNTFPVGEDEHSTFGAAAGPRCVRSRLEDLCDVSEMPGSAHTVSIADDFTNYVMENSIHAGIPPSAKVSDGWPRRNS